METVLEDLFEYLELELDIKPGMGFGNFDSFQAAADFVNNFFFAKIDLLLQNKDITYRQKLVINQRIGAESHSALAVLELFVHGLLNREELVDDIFLLEKNKNRVVSFFL